MKIKKKGALGRSQELSISPSLGQARLILLSELYLSCKEQEEARSKQIDTQWAIYISMMTLVTSAIAAIVLYIFDMRFSVNHPMLYNLIADMYGSLIWQAKVLIILITMLDAVGLVLIPVAGLIRKKKRFDLSLFIPTLEDNYELCKYPDERKAASVEMDIAHLIQIQEDNDRSVFWLRVGWRIITAVLVLFLAVLVYAVIIA